MTRTAKEISADIVSVAQSAGPGDYTSVFFKLSKLFEEQRQLEFNAATAERMYTEAEVQARELEARREGFEASWTALATKDQMLIMEDNLRAYLKTLVK